MSSACSISDVANSADEQSSSSRYVFRVERTTGIEPASSAWKWHEADLAGGAVTCRNVL